VIEWGYQTLFDRYPDSRDVEYAAIQLCKLYLARGKPVSACVYFIPFRVVNSRERNHNLRPQPDIAAQKREFSIVISITGIGIVTHGMRNGLAPFRIISPG